MKAMLIGAFALGFTIVSAQAGNYGVAPADPAAAPTAAPAAGAKPTRAQCSAQGKSQGLASAALKTYVKSCLAGTL